MFFTLLGTRQGGHFSSSCCCGEGDGETLGGRSGHGDGRQSTMGSSLSHDGTGNYFGDLSSFHNTDHISRPEKKKKALLVRIMRYGLDTSLRYHTSIHRRNTSKKILQVNHGHL